VARIFHRYACGGIAMRRLACELTADQISSPQGNPQWDAGTLGRMLRNPAYIGRACFGKTQTAPGVRRLNRTSRLAGRSVPSQAGTVARPRSEWIAIPVPALVSQEVFALVQRRLAENAKFSPRHTKTPVLLQGLLICGRVRVRLPPDHGRTGTEEVLGLPLPGHQRLGAARR
jgi:site-specific DNA recombinase